MKKVNKRYKDHDICSLIGTHTVISYIDKYTIDIIAHLKEIQQECEKETRSSENLFLPVILICDESTDMVQHKLELLKSSLDRYLFADEDFKLSSVKHDKITKTQRVSPPQKFRKYDIKTENFPQKLNIQPDMPMEGGFDDGISY